MFYQHALVKFYIHIFLVLIVNNFVIQLLWLERDYNKDIYLSIYLLQTSKPFIKFRWMENRKLFRTTLKVSCVVYGKLKNVYKNDSRLLRTLRQFILEENNSM